MTIKELIRREQNMRRRKTQIAKLFTDFINLFHKKNTTSFMELPFEFFSVLLSQSQYTPTQSTLSFC